MKTFYKTAVIPGAIALAAILLSVSLPFNAVRVAGFGIVVMLLGIAGLEYGNEKRLTGTR